MTSGSDLLLLGDIVRRERGSIRTGPFGTTLKASEYAPVGVPVVSVGEVGYGTFRIHKETRRVGPEVLKRLPVYRLNVGDIVFARKGSVDRCATVRDAQEGWFLGSDGIRVRLGRGSQVNPIYLGYALRAADVRRWLLRNATGTTMATLNQDLLESVPVWIPERREQDRIASALEDASGLIDALEGLIAKKRDVKQGMMQELLTGNSRLPGFTGKWELLPVADNSHLKARIGWQGLTTGEYLTSGEYRLVGGTDFKNGHVNWGSTAFVDKWRFDQDKNIQLVNGDVLITKDGTIGKVAIVDSMPGPSTLNSGVFVLRPKRDAYDSGFIYWMLRSRVFEEFVAGLSAGSTITHLYQRDLVTLELLVPPTLEEQAAISRILTDADVEIVALERRLESARGVKVGIMQELLTGRTRLPVKEEA
ncbi:restriction endonuclease subunit S [Arthrobacter sp. 2RAF22]|uniref:restriction endonuclease subunit S n=1 Tax=Arthrobacter sp. 2RAF22 TaxID=3232996 RepID=UPI003F908D00